MAAFATEDESIDNSADMSVFRITELLERAIRQKNDDAVIVLRAMWHNKTRRWDHSQLKTLSEWGSGKRLIAGMMPLGLTETGERLYIERQLASW